MQFSPKRIPVSLITQAEFKTSRKSRQLEKERESERKREREEIELGQKIYKVHNDAGSRC